MVARLEDTRFYMKRSSFKLTRRGDDYDADFFLGQALFRQCSFAKISTSTWAQAPVLTKIENTPF